MSAVQCPNGHVSTDTEWCDTCGAKIGGAADVPQAASAPSASASSAPPPVAAGEPMPCPHCAAMNDENSLFCEECGYDFTTGQRPAEPPPAPSDSVPSAPTGPPWVVVIEVDAEWYAVKGALADQALPTPSSSTVQLAKHTALIGRSSRSHVANPEIAIDGDTGVSRRHAQLVRDRDALTLIDLSSTNGTFVLRGDTAVSDDIEPLAPGVPATLRDGDRIYVGAWTRLTVRRSA
jgi:FHA domain